jgi:curli biogenesis system outer membrane secretion channel CsgG
MKTLRLLVLLSSVLGAITAQAARIAVTDLAYSERVSGYFHFVDYHNKSSARASQSDREHDSFNSSSASSRSSFSENSQTDYTEVTRSYSYIEYGELRKFAGDIKGEILKTGGFQLSQAKPYTAKGSEQIYDIIGRIRKGAYPGADYVLFGTVSELDFRDEINPIIGTDTLSNTFSLMLVAEFSLIDTRTYEVTAAFSATGEGQDVRIVTAGSRVVPSRGRVVSEVSKSLGVDVARQINEQLSGGGAPENAYPGNGGTLQEGEVMHFNP